MLSLSWFLRYMNAIAFLVLLVYVMQSIPYIVGYACFLMLQGYKAPFLDTHERILLFSKAFVNGSGKIPLQLPLLVSQCAGTFTQVTLGQQPFSWIQLLCICDFNLPQWHGYISTAAGDWLGMLELFGRCQRKLQFRQGGDGQPQINNMPYTMKPELHIKKNRVVDFHPPVILE